MLVKLWVKNDILNIQSVKEDQCNKNFLMFSPTFFNISPFLTNYKKSPFSTIFSNFSTFITILNNFVTIFPNFKKYWDLFIDFNVKVLFTCMLLTASSSFSTSQPDPDLEESVEDVEDEPDLDFQFALFQDGQCDLDFS